MLFGKKKAFVGVNTVISVPGLTIDANFSRPFENENGTAKDNADITFEKKPVGGASLPPSGETTTKGEAAQGDAPAPAPASGSDDGTGLLSSMAAATVKMLSTGATADIHSALPGVLTEPLVLVTERVWTNKFQGYDRYQKSNPYGHKVQERRRYVPASKLAVGKLDSSGLSTKAVGGKRTLLQQPDTSEEKVVSAKSTPAQWAVVRDECNLFTVGQVVGNGFSVKFDPEPADPVKVCLAVRFDIPQDTATYKYKDFANSREDGTLGWPQLMEVTAASDMSPFCAMIGKSGTYFPILRRDFTAGNYTMPFVTFVVMMLMCCACSVMSVKKTRPEIKAYTLSWATWTCSSCFISFLMVCVLIPALIPGQCPPVSGWGYVYGFGGLCMLGCVASTCVTVGCVLRGNDKTQRVEPDGEGKPKDVQEKPVEENAPPAFVNEEAPADVSEA